MRKFSLMIALAASTALMLSACAPSTSNETDSVSESETELNAASESNENGTSNATTDSASENGDTVDSPEALSLAISVITTSCDKAMSEGIVETYTYLDGGPGATAYMIPESQAIEGYSAVSLVEGSAVPELIYESLAFAACTLIEPAEAAEASMEENEPDEPQLYDSSLFRVIEAEEGRFVMPFSESETGEQTLAEVIYDPSTLVMSDFRLVNSEGVETVVEIDMQYGSSQEGFDYLQQAVEALR